MRARYSAFAVRQPRYLLATWHASTRPATLELDGDLQWMRLDVHATLHGGLLDSGGVVEFTAHFRLHGRRHEQHEVSRFVKENRRWFYVGDLDQTSQGQRG
jgi:SEC-C motif-containing protein